MSLDLSTALKIAQAALEAGRAENIVALSAVVTDAGGNIRVALRADGVGMYGVDIAHAKAQTSLGFNRSSMQLAKVFGGNPGAVAALSGVTGGRFLPLGGGVPIRDVAGTIVGAAAVSGSSPENDERFIVAAIRAHGLQVAD
jgi:uncharacterized protein GlcG (DUF336 family)